MARAEDEPLSVYMAGPLFHHADLLGNAVLAERLVERSRGRYAPILPQDIQQAHTSAREIRDADLGAIMAADLVLANFNGAEVDAGTVVEFIYAKVLDIPAVILRTDSRSAGENLPGSDPWNLMCSSYPRTEIALVDALAAYGAVRRRCGSSAEAARLLVDEVADRVIEALDRVWNQPAVIPADADRQQIIYEWAAAFPGLSATGALSEGYVEGILRRRRARQDRAAGPDRPAR